MVLGQTHPCPGGERLCHRLISAAEPAAGQCSARHNIHNIRSGGRGRVKSLLRTPGLQKVGCWSTVGGDKTLSISLIN